MASPADPHVRRPDGVTVLHRDGRVHVACDGAAVGTIVRNDLWVDAIDLDGRIVATHPAHDASERELAHVLAARARGAHAGDRPSFDVALAWDDGRAPSAPTPTRGLRSAPRPRERAASLGLVWTPR